MTVYTSKKTKKTNKKINNFNRHYGKSKKLLNSMNNKEIIEKIVTDIIKDLVGIPGIKAEILKDDNDVSGTFKNTLNKINIVIIIRITFCLFLSFVCA